jgi:hypothetical protein
MKINTYTNTNTGFWNCVILKMTYTGSSKNNAGIIKTYHSKTVKHIEMIPSVKMWQKNVSFGHA